MTDNNGSGARIASTVARVVKGALTGGVQGIAIEFAPEIIKTTLIIIACVLFVPVIIFSAIPNIMFGYGSAEDLTITEFTDAAKALGDAYSQVGTYEETESQSLIEKILALFTGDADDEDAEDTEDVLAGEGYDAVSIIKTFGNTNDYWLIAITSVANNQDIYSITEATIADMVKQKTESVWQIHVSTESDGEEDTIVRTLKIDVYDITPDELMTKLAFTEEQRNWAQLLYNSLVQAQDLDYAYSDGAGLYGTNYGDITFTDTVIEVVYYNQADARWSGKSYGKTGTIARSGCGPTALAIAVATYVNSSITPVEVAKWSADNGYYVEGVGSRHSLITDGGKHFGLTVEPLGKDAKKVADALANGKLVIAIMSKGHFTNSGHFIVLRGMTADGKILVADPGSYKRSGQEWSLSLIVNEANRGAGASGPFWAVAG